MLIESFANFVKPTRTPVTSTRKRKPARLDLRSLSRTHPAKPTEPLLRRRCLLQWEGQPPSRLRTLALSGGTRGASSHRSASAIRHATNSSTVNRFTIRSCRANPNGTTKHKSRQGEFLNLYTAFFIFAFCIMRSDTCDDSRGITCLSNRGFSVLSHDGPNTFLLFSSRSLYSQ